MMCWYWLEFTFLAWYAAWCYFCAFVPVILGAFIKTTLLKYPKNSCIYILTISVYTHGWLWMFHSMAIIFTDTNIIYNAEDYGICLKWNGLKGMSFFFNDGKYIQASYTCMLCPYYGLMGFQLVLFDRFYDVIKLSSSAIGCRSHSIRFELML